MPYPNFFDFLLKLCSLGFVFFVYVVILVGLAFDQDPEIFFHIILIGSIWYGYSNIIKEQLYDILKDIYAFAVLQKREFQEFLKDN